MSQIQCLESKIENATSILAKLCIEPLKKGQGITVGNALRRTLLSDIPGIAIVGVHIDNVNHEFSTIPGVREDVIEIILNLKQIVFKGNLSEAVIARLEFQGPGIVTAQDFSLPSGITLVEPTQYIASLTGQDSLMMEVLIEPGYGYLVSEQFINQLPKGFLAVDAVFMPVRKANFFVETSRTTTVSISESIIFEIITDGSIEPLAAMDYAISTLEKLFSSFNVNSIPSSQPVILVEKSEASNSFDNVLLADLLLSVRAYNALKRANVHNLSELLKFSKEDLLELKNFGQKSADEVCESLQNNFGITLAKTKSNKDAN
jgi:DNA-directed RNA polymerase subunit alpha